MEGPHPGTPVLREGLSSWVESCMRSGASEHRVLSRPGSGFLPVCASPEICLPPSLRLLTWLRVTLLGSGPFACVGVTASVKVRGPRLCHPAHRPSRAQAPSLLGAAPWEHGPQGGRVSFRTDLMLGRLSPSTPFSLRRSGGGEVGLTLLGDLSSGQGPLAEGRGWCSGYSVEVAGVERAVGGGRTHFSLRTHPKLGLPDDKKN